jgi:hypothetical protein
VSRPPRIGEGEVNMGTELFKPSLVYGFGTAHYFHRPVSQGVYEADLWVVALYLPLFPLGTWVIRPQGMRVEHTDEGQRETYAFEFLGRRRTTAKRFLSMYARAWVRVAVLLGPLIACYFFAIGIDGGEPSTLKTCLFCGAAAWAIGLVLYWANGRDRIYKTSGV